MGWSEIFLVVFSSLYTSLPFFFFKPATGHTMHNALGFRPIPPPFFLICYLVRREILGFCSCNANVRATLAPFLHLVFLRLFFFLSLSLLFVGYRCLSSPLSRSSRFFTIFALRRWGSCFFFFFFLICLVDEEIIYVSFGQEGWMAGAVFDTCIFPLLQQDFLLLSFPSLCIFPIFDYLVYRCGRWEAGVVC